MTLTSTPIETFETVNLHLADGAATVELNRPDKLNAWNKQFGYDIASAFKRCEEDDVRAVVIRGAGRGFSSGADLTSLDADVTPEGKPDVYKRLTEVYHPVMRAIRDLPKPVVSAVHGPAVGIGCSLALCADLVLAAESAYFLLAFVNIGLVPDGGSSVYIPSRVGLARAKEMALLGERIPAAQALDWGLINRVFSDDEFDDEVEKIVTKLAKGPTKSYAGTKRQLHAWQYGRMEEQLELEATIQQEMAASGDFQEGVMAFLQKRDAEFQGA
jgi:2-(1,2-epoxy-1,2-dihydrophenyl)acetyl-CoA isomerase